MRDPLAIGVKRGRLQSAILRDLCLYCVLFGATAGARADDSSYASAAKEHAYCAAFFITAALSPANQTRQGQLRQKAAFHKQSAVTLADGTAFERDSGAALEKMQAELTGEQSAINAMVTRNLKYCDAVTARTSGLVARRAGEPAAGVSGTRR